MNRPTLTIVYDGPASAGKTSNLQRLAERNAREGRSGLVSPEEIDGETTQFDWLRLRRFELGDGSVHDVLLLSTPGHGAYREQRKVLLGLADVVVFVVESGAHRIRWAIPMLGEVGAALAPNAAPRVVVQANKQDLEDALSADEVARRLSTSCPTVSACASTGAGVAETLVEAIRAALRRGQRQGPARHGPTVPDDPHGLLQHLSQRVAAAGTRTKTLVPGAATSPRGEASVEGGVPRSLRRASATSVTPLFPPDDPTVPRSGAPRDERHSGEVLVEFDIPDGSEPTQHLWPARSVRAWLRTQPSPAVFARLASGDVEGVTETARFRTHDHWRYETIELGRRALRARAEAAVGLGALVPSRQVLALVEDEVRGHRLWLVVERGTANLDRRLHELQHEPLTTAGLMVRLLGFYLKADGLRHQGGPVIYPDLCNFLVDTGELRYVGTQTDGSQASALQRAARSTYDQLSELLRRQWLDALAGAIGSFDSDTLARWGIRLDGEGLLTSVRAWLGVGEVRAAVEEVP